MVAEQSGRERAADERRSPAPETRSCDVAIIGGGVIGCAVARELAADRDVIVVERGQIAAEATALAAGEITMTPSYSDFPVVAEHANEFFRAYDGTGEFNYEERPSVELVTPEREGEARRRVERLREEHGLDVAFVDGATVEERYPRIDLSEYAGAIEHHGTGFVDPYTLAVTLRADAEDRGATVLTEAAVTEVRVEEGEVRGIETEAGSIDAEFVVAAAGWRTGNLLSGVLELPLRPYRTQCVVLEPEAELDEAFPMGWIPGEHVYFRPELNGDLLVGGFSFAEDDPEGASGQEDEGFRDHVAALVPRFVRDFDRAKFVNGWAGVDGATPDTRPIIDRPEDAPDGLVIATGFHGRGIMTSPVAATLVRSFITGEGTDLPKSEFALSRFESRSPDFEFTSISSGDDSYGDEEAH